MKRIKIDWQALLLLFLTVGILLNQQLIKRIETVGVSGSRTPAYQAALILKDSEDPFWKQFKNGADKAAGFYQFSLDTTYIKERGQVRTSFAPSELIDKAKVSSADGIIAFISEDPKNAEVIDEASKAGIPTLTLENDVANSKRTSFVGYNAYRFGQEAGKQMIEALAGKGKIAIVMNRSETAELDSQNLKISGFLNEINQVSGLEVSSYIVAEDGLYGTQALVAKLMDSESPIQGLFITNAVDTEAVAQLLVEYNKVGSYQVVGSGNSEAVLRAVEKQILYASVYVNAYEMGYKCIETLAKVKQGQTVPSYIDTTIGVLTKNSGEAGQLIEGDGK